MSACCWWSLKFKWEVAWPCRCIIFTGISYFFVCRSITGVIKFDIFTLNYCRMLALQDHCPLVPLLFITKHPVCHAFQEVISWFKIYGSTFKTFIVKGFLLCTLSYRNFSRYILFYISFPVDWICYRYSLDDTAEFHLIITFDLYLVQLFIVFSNNSQSQFWDVCKKKKPNKKV